MAHVRLSDLRKTYGSAVAVDHFDLDVGDGEFVALLGPSGCGKTTIMRMIAGITRQDAGEVYLGDVRVDEMPPERRNVGLVFQSYALFPHMTVFANVGFGLRMRRLQRTQIRKRVAAALELVDLAALGARYPRELSGGQQQRVALARALVLEPGVLLLDEPLSNLDAKLRDQLREELRALQRRLGITTIYVTHDQSEALALADRVVLMNKGRTVETGTPAELYRRPRHRFTAEFLGHTNLLPGKAESGSIWSPWGTALSTANGASGDVLMSVRPEDIVLRPEDSGLGRVAEVTFLGSEVEHKVDLAGFTLRARSTGQRARILPVGTRVAVDLPSEVHMVATR